MVYNFSSALVAVSHPVWISSMRLRILTAFAMVAAACAISIASIGRLEMTGADLLARRDWKSTDVQVAGIYLGMSRDAAIRAARSHGFQVLQYAPPMFRLAPCSGFSVCFLAGKSGKPDDVRVRFGNSDEVVEIDVEHREKRGRILNSLRGQTRQFFSDPYSDSLRLDLFGKETRQGPVEGGYSPRMSDTTCVYAARGITITTTPSPMTAPRPDLVRLSLVFPASLNGAASQMMRRLLLDHARRRKACKRGIPVALNEEVVPRLGRADQTEEIPAVDEVLERLATLEHPQARVPELRYFAGLPVEETADLMRIPERTVKADWAVAKGWMRPQLSARGAS
jgi:hypothetical protein